MVLIYISKYPNYGYVNCKLFKIKYLVSFLYKHKIKALSRIAAWFVLNSVSLAAS